MKKIMSIIGNRPQLMKLDNQLKQVVVWTGQHYDKCMKDIFMQQLAIPKPKYDLGETKTGAMIDKLVEVIRKENPEYILVYGDTNSTLAGAIAAKQCGKKLIHIEAGMRSNNLSTPEEQNRRMVDQIADVLLCSSMRAMENLEAEKVLGRVGYTGNPMIDTINFALPTKDMRKKYGEYYLLTLHRAENVDNKEVLSEIIDALGKSGKSIVFPCHPRTAKMLETFDIKLPDNIAVLPPVGYKEMISLIGFAKKVLTDSGGIQVEAHFLRTPCITLRNETEWIETVEEGWNNVVGTDKDMIVEALNEPFEYDKKRDFIYGKGDAKKKIRDYLKSI